MLLQPHDCADLKGFGLGSPHCDSRHVEAVISGNLRPGEISGKKRHVEAMVLARMANRPTNPSSIGGHIPKIFSLAFLSPNELAMYCIRILTWGRRFLTPD
jgi:hypothetical protein